MIALFIVLVIASKSSSVATGGSGKVVGVIGKMGSGKTVFAVRMAYRRMLRGANVRTNFTMNFPIHHTSPCPPKCDKKRRCVCARKKIMKTSDGVKYKAPCFCQVKKRWALFHGWMELAALKDAVVIVDEAHLMAPSHDYHAIPEIARWKMSMARKFRLDVYWISQNEKKVSASLRNDTNTIYVCKSWLQGWGRAGAPMIFSAKGYEAEKLNRRDQHSDRKAYFFRLLVGELYDSLEVMRSDELVGRDGTMKMADAITVDYNADRLSRKEKTALEVAANKDGFMLVDGAMTASDTGESLKKSDERCGAPTAKGTPCKQRANKCPFHKEQLESEDTGETEFGDQTVSVKKQIFTL